MKQGIDWKSKLSQMQLPIIILVMVIIMGILRPTTFLTVNTLVNILLSVSLYGIMVCGTIMPILSGGIDMSIGSTAAFSSALCVLHIIQHGYTSSAVVVGILVGLGVGALVGLVQGAIIAAFDLPPFIVTFASKNILFAMAQLTTQNRTIPIMEPKLFTGIGSAKVFGFIPLPIIVFLGMAVISFFILNYTILGKKIMAVGGNRIAARYSGIRSGVITALCFMMSGLTAALSGIVLAAFNQQSIATAARAYDGDVLTALVIGGVSLAGGEGNIQGAIFGTLLVGVMNRSLVMLGVDSIYHNIVKGVLIVLAVSIDMRSRSRGTGLVRKKKKVGNA